jgi:FkbM family methyltransferase
MLELLKKSPIRFAKRLLVEHHDKIRGYIPDTYFVCSVPGGKIYLNLKESPMMLERCFGFYEPEKTRAIQSFLKPGDAFVDVGGNKGDFAFLAAKLVGKNGRVVCIEPEPTNFGWICRSAELNGYTNINLCNLALSNQDAESLLHLGSKSGFHTLLSGAPDREHGSIAVKTRTLDGLLQELKINSVSALKIDVEGAELQVLQGAAETIRGNPSIIVLLDLHPSLGVDPREIFDLLTAFGLTVCKMRSPYNIPAAPQPDTFEVLARRA